MASTYPTALDTFTNPNTTDAQNSPSHAGQHGDSNDAIEALEVKVGADSSAVTTSHDYKLTPRIITLTDGASVDIDLDQVGVFSLTLGGNRTLTISNEVAGRGFILRLIQDGTGSRTISWFTTIKWPSGVVPTLTTTASKIDTFFFIVTSAGNYEGYVLGQNL